MYELDITSMKMFIRRQQMQVVFPLDGNIWTVNLSFVKMNYGERPYMICPHCCKRFQILYFQNNHIGCRDCMNLKKYEAIQNSTKGGFTDITYRMERIAARHKINIQYPFCYMEHWHDDRLSAADSKATKIRKTLMVLQGLENMRSQAILLGAIYDTKTIQAVISGRHPNFRKHTLMEIYTNFYPW